MALRVSESQASMFAPNSKSLEWAKANPNCVPLAICANHELVGFAMYEPRGHDIFSVHRFMIDARYQRKGIGFQAMVMIIEKIRSLGGKTIYLSFRPGNFAAKCLYEKLGFVLHEEEADGELLYRLGPA